ncbi:MAG: cysteine desulfurase [Hyphomicrobiaceae bacterium]|nr:cysteine desulfurase [Hyphomicrobiaceae bacterium]
MAAVRTYLDYNASAPLLDEAREAMIAAMLLSGNPSSVHAEGRRLRAVIEDARAAVADLAHAASSDVVFTSGATEANATVLRSGFDVALRASIEHDSVLAAIAASGARVVELPVDGHGVIDVKAVRLAIEGLPDGAKAVVAVQVANNETGVVQPVAEVAAIAKARGLHVHCDAVQAPGRMGVDINSLGVDTLVLSAHKMGGPKGVGALVVRDGVVVTPLIAGGGQERYRRAGTENVAAIAGFGAAARAAMAGQKFVLKLAALRDRLEAGVLTITPAAVVVGAGAARLPNTSCIALAGQSAELMLIKLDLAGVAVSAGAACSSGKAGRSHVLAAMGLDPAIARAAIRVSVGAATTDADVDRFLDAWVAVTRAPSNVSLGSNPLRSSDPISMYTLQRDDVARAPSIGGR